jgi:hypothetical protein
MDSSATECGQKNKSLENFKGTYRETNPEFVVFWCSASTNIIKVVFDGVHAVFVYPNIYQFPKK